MNKWCGYCHFGKDCSRETSSEDFRSMWGLSRVSFWSTSMEACEWFDLENGQPWLVLGYLGIEGTLPFQQGLLLLAQCISTDRPAAGTATFLPYSLQVLWHVMFHQHQFMPPLFWVEVLHISSSANSVTSWPSAFNRTGFHFSTSKQVNPFLLNYPLNLHITILWHSNASSHLKQDIIPSVKCPSLESNLPWVLLKGVFVLYLSEYGLMDMVSHQLNSALNYFLISIYIVITI